MHDRIIDNVGQYTAEDLEGYIRNGVVTLEELRQQGLNVNTRHQIEKLLQNDPEEDDWQHACSVNTEAAYQDYLAKYPEGNHRSEAKHKRDVIQAKISAASQNDEDKLAWEQVDKNSFQALDEFIRNNPTNRFRFDARKLLNKMAPDENRSGLDRIQGVIEKGKKNLNAKSIIPKAIKELIINGKATEEDLIELFRKDHSVLPVDIVRELDEIISFDDLSRAGIQKDFIIKLQDENFESKKILDKKVSVLERIPDGFTEIYFWGIPSSGKTCAVGAIMSALTDGRGVKSVETYPDSQGAKYMMPLAASFQENQVCILPESTAVYETFEMRYRITDENNKEHGVAFIDMAGELFNSITLMQEGHELDGDHLRALDVLNNILYKKKSRNPKIHFFIIEYGNEKETNYDHTTKQLLENCLSYLNTKHILDETTIGAYILITKADKAPEGTDFGEYVNQNYDGFGSTLKKLMEKTGINTRRGESVVKRFPFSIGDVCFRNWCIYDPEWTQYIIEEIKNRSYGEQTGRIGKFKKAIRK